MGNMQSFNGYRKLSLAVKPLGNHQEILVFQMYETMDCLEINSNVISRVNLTGMLSLFAELC